MVHAKRSPTNLNHLCAAVVFERISFTGIVALFVLYLNEHLGIPAAQAALRLGGFVALTYLTPVAGGLAGDRWLGSQRACVIGTALLALGGCGLMLDRVGGLYPGLGLIAIGQGLFKPNAQALLGGLFGSADPRRAAAFRRYYVASNVGSMLGPVAVEVLRSRAGWGFSFVAVLLGATLAMLAMGLPVTATRSAAAGRPAATGQKLPRRARRALVALCALAMLFCALYSQVSGVLLFWVRDHTDRRLLGQWVPTAYFAALPALFVVCLAPLLSGLALTCRPLQVTLTKLRLGLLALAVSFGLLGIAALGMRPAALLWTVLAVALASTSEILVLATGMDVVSQALPAAWSGLGYGLWCVALAVGTGLGGLLGCLWGRLSPAEFFGLLASGAVLGMLSLGRRPVRLPMG